MAGASFTGGVRVEKDALGEVRVPADHLWGAQTQRSIDNFPIGVDRFRWGRGVIRAFGVLKKAAAIANGELSELPANKVALVERDPAFFHDAGDDFPGRPEGVPGAVGHDESAGLESGVADRLAVER